MTYTYTYIHAQSYTHLLVQYKQIFHSCSNCHWTLVVCHNQLSQLCLAWIWFGPAASGEGTAVHLAFSKGAIWKRPHQIRWFPYDLMIKSMGFHALESLHSNILILVTGGQGIYIYMHRSMYMYILYNYYFTASVEPHTDFKIGSLP